VAQKILIVDDDAGFRAFVSRFLEQKGYAIVIASDGTTAISVARRENPDLIVLDLVLPMGDGFTVMQRLKQIPAMAEIPTIAISGTDMETHRRRALQAGANIFLPKPVKNEVLLSEIEKLLLAKTAASAQGMKKILLVEDEPNFRQMMDTYLKWAGYKIAIAPDSISALSAVTREKPDLILLDIGLPGGDGMMVLQKVKANPATAHIPVIMVSGKDPAFYQTQSRLAGAAAYFQKPLKNEALLEAIRDALGKV
jgi:CheY-like chemotaxis protein